MILPMPGGLAIPAQGGGFAKKTKSLSAFWFFTEKPQNTKGFRVFCPRNRTTFEKTTNSSQKTKKTSVKPKN